MSKQTTLADLQKTVDKIDEIAKTPTPEEKRQIERVKAGQLATAPPSITQVLEAALQSGRSAEELERLHALYREIKADQAKAYYDEAFARFQADCPPIPKRRTADIATQSGSKYSYCFASLDDIDAVVMPLLNEHGFNRTFGDSSVAEGNLTVECILNHRDGHSERRSFSVPIASRAGMSEAQKHAAALTFAKRYAFASVAGFRITDIDDDGADKLPAEKITQEQAHGLNDMIIEAEVDKARFLAWQKVEKLTDITVDRYDECVAMLEKKLQARRNT